MEKSNELEDSLKTNNEPDPQTSGKKCYICLKGFTLRKKHQCKFCFSAVCSDHCQRSYQKDPSEAPQPICDICLQSFIKKSIEFEIKSDIESLKEELKNAQTVNNRLELEHFEKTSSVSRLENKLEDLTKDYEKKIRELEHELQSEDLEAREMVELYERTEKSLKESRAELREAEEKTSKTKSELENTEKQMTNLKETTEGLTQQIVRINERLKGSLSIENLESIVCEPCKKKIGETARRRRETPSILEDPTVTLSAIDERQSVLESVREYKEVLAKQTSSPSEESGCWVI